MHLKDKNILVTGGTGFIGSAVVNKLINQGCEINIISMPGDSTWRIDDISKCRLYEINLLNPQKTEKCIDDIKPEIIFHIAGIIDTRISRESINTAFSLNLEVTKNLLLALNNYDYELFLNTGSGNEYGNNEPPFYEDARENPISPYSASKIAQTYFSRMISNVYEKPIITVRPFLIYGPKQISRSLIPSLIYSGLEKKKLSLTPCEQTRDFIYVEDVADAYLSLAIHLKKIIKKEIFNIGSGIGTQLLEVVNLIKEQMDDTKFFIGDKPYRPGETMNHYSSIDKIKDIVNWTPKWTLKEGIKATIKWWQDNRDKWINQEQLWVRD